MTAALAMAARVTTARKRILASGCDVVVVVVLEDYCVLDVG